MLCFLRQAVGSVWLLLSATVLLGGCQPGTPQQEPVARTEDPVPAGRAKPAFGPSTGLPAPKGAGADAQPKAHLSVSHESAPAARPLSKMPPSEEAKQAQALAEVRKNLMPVDPENPEHTKELQRRLGLPLVEQPEKLVRLDPVYQIWIDKPPRSVFLVGAVCQRQVPLELFACLKGSKEHEAVLTVFTKAYLVHAALLATGAEPGGPAQFEPKYEPPRGPEIEIALVWRDLQGQLRRARAQEWVRDMATRKAMQHPWVFAGSQVRVNQVNQQREYWADLDGNLICTSNFGSAMLDVPIRSTDADDELALETFTEHIPPLGTPVTIILTPKLERRNKAN